MFLSHQQLLIESWRNASSTQKEIYGGIKYLRKKQKAVSEKEKDNTG